MPFCHSEASSPYKDVPFAVAPLEADRMSCDTNAKKSFYGFPFLIFTVFVFSYMIYGG